VSHGTAATNVQEARVFLQPDEEYYGSYSASRLVIRTVSWLRTLHKHERVFDAIMGTECRVWQFCFAVFSLLLWWVVFVGYSLRFGWRRGDSGAGPSPYPECKEHRIVLYMQL